jgi:lipopolysaccharide export system ATP-binding protein
MTRLMVDTISMRFGHKHVLSDVYLDVGPGDIVGVLGRNGCGKSTLYKCLLGLYRASTGTVRIDGKHITKAAAPALFAYLPQGTFLPWHMPVWKSARLILGKEAKFSLLVRDSRAMSLIHKRARALSTGELRYVECLIVLSQNRPVRLLDEPFSQIEPAYCEVLAARIRESSQYTATLISDHLYREVQRLCGQIRVISGGTLRTAENSLEGLQRAGYAPDADAL